MTANQAIHDPVSYRVVLLETVQHRLLLHKQTQSSVLPRVRVPRSSRRTEALRTAIRAQCGVAAFVVDYIDMNALEPCVVAEFRNTDRNVKLARGGLDEVRDSEFSGQERCAIESLLNGRSACSIARLGWIDDAAAWVEAATGKTVQSETGIEQFNAGGGFALLRFSVEDGREFWLKATGNPHIHEFALTKLLSELACDCLPDLLATKPEWNAWLTASAGCAVESLPTQPRELFVLLERAVESMAELQVKTVDHTRELRLAGALDQCAEDLAKHSQQLFDYAAEAMDMQPSARVPPIGRSRLEEIKSIFDDVCGRMTELDLPETIIHGDLNIGNLLLHEDMCRFIDWSEAYVGNPLVSLQHLLLLNQAEPAELRKQIDRVLIARYRDVIERVCERDSLDEALLYMPLMAAASALYGRGDWCAADAAGAAPRHAYARSVVRHMDRAAHDPILLKMLSARSGFGSGRVSSATGFAVPIAG